MTVDWTHELSGQFDLQWNLAHGPSLETLTDEEYLWEPVPGCWSIRPTGPGGAPSWSKDAATARRCLAIPGRMHRWFRAVVTGAAAEIAIGSFERRRVKAVQAQVIAVLKIKHRRHAVSVAQPLRIGGTRIFADQQAGRDLGHSRTHEVA